MTELGVLSFTRCCSTASRGLLLQLIGHQEEALTRGEPPMFHRSIFPTEALAIYASARYNSSNDRRIVAPRVQNNAERRQDPPDLAVHGVSSICKPRSVMASMPNIDADFSFDFRNSFRHAAAMRERWP